MNKDEIIESILLRQSGELDAEGSAALEQALATDPEVAALARDYDGLANTARNAREDIPVSEFTIERILQEGREAQTARQHTAPRSNGLPRGLVSMAAAVLLLLGAAVTYMMQQHKGLINDIEIAENLAGSQSDAGHPDRPIAQPAELAVLAPAAVDEDLETLDEELYQVSDELFGHDFWGQETFAEGPAPSDIDSIAAELLALEESI